MSGFSEWLIQGAVGPAAVALPVNWLAAELSVEAKVWFRRLRHADDLSRLVRAATASSVDLTHAEFDAVRRLLEDRQTWSILGRGTVENLAARIATCLPPGEGRTGEDADTAAMSIARGLLEFAVADLDPKVFQQLLLARLDRMETSEASALDSAMLDLHADLVTRFTSVTEQLQRVLDRLPPSPARQGDIAIYLKAVIDRLNGDLWPHDQQLKQFEQPPLIPAAIECKLRVSVTTTAGEQDLDADVLAEQCQRLVILGGPGSGKTWLAKRAARRCAEKALRALAAGATLDEVELPLYTTCSGLFSAVGSPRERAVSGALDQLGDLGGSRLNASVGAFLAERDVPTLLVIDSLDEAQGSDDPLRRADTLPWRIVLTSRPSSWNWQLVIEKQNDSHRVGELQPLLYPDDVEPIIERWFAGRLESGQDLANQIARRHGLQQAATVPLILAFYCIVGGREPLPDFRRHLNSKVLNRILTGRWRGSRVGNKNRPDVGTCLQMLEAWAWAGSTSHPVSGVGTWADNILTGRSHLGEADEDALDHVAAPVGPPDVDTGTIPRRFIHRSIREHLVAEHVAGLPMDDAVEILLPHIWYDPDWEYSAPAAIANHPQRDQLLRHIICRATRWGRLPEDLAVIDAGRETRRFLARIASESSEADWSPEIAETIGQARVELARSAQISDLGWAAHWPTSNRQVLDILLRMLGGQGDGRKATRLVGVLVQLGPLPEDKRRARDALLELAARQSSGFQAEELAGALVQLDPTTEDRRRAREILLGVLHRQPGSWVLSKLVAGVAQLAPTAEDRRQARDALLELPGRRPSGDRADDLAAFLFQLDPTKLAGALLQLDPTAEDWRRARDVLLALLADEPRGWDAVRLAGALVQLGPTAEDRRRAREILLGVLNRQRGGQHAARLAGALLQLGPLPEDKRRARDALLELAARRYSGDRADELVGALLQLDPTAEDKRQARDALLGLLADEPDCLARQRAYRRADSARPDGGRQAPGPRRATQAAGRFRRPLGRYGHIRWVASRTTSGLGSPGHPGGRRQASRP